MVENVDSALLLEVLKEIRKDVRDQRTLAVMTAEHVRKLDRLTEVRFIAVERRIVDVDERIGVLKDDLELMIKSELMGALGNFETRMISLIDERLAGR